MNLIGYNMDKQLPKNDLDNSWNDQKLGEIWIKIFEIRDAFLFFVEKKRNEKLIK